MSFSRTRRILLSISLILDLVIGLYGYESYVLRLNSYITPRNKRSSPLWGGRPADKRCIDFCRFINCNNGECVLNQETCRLACKCQDGFTGHRCTERTQEEGTQVEQMQEKVTQDARTEERRPDGGRQESGVKTNTNQNASNTDVIRISLSISSTFSSNQGQKEKEKENIRPTTTTVRSKITLFHNEDDSEGKGTTRRIITTVSTPISSVSDEDFIEKKSGQVIQEEPKTSTVLLETTPNLRGIQTSTENVLVKETEAWRGSDFVLKNLSLDHHLKNGTGVVKKPIPFQSIYLDECRDNCTDGVCIPLNRSFHCLPMQHYCQNGFYCGQHGVCDPEYIRDKKYRCLCEPGWIGDTCSKRCDLDCGVYGICVLYDVTENVKKCVCHKNYTGVRCDKLKPKPKEASEQTWYWYVVAVCVTLAVVLTAMIVIIPYLLWKKRWLFIMKIVHYFQNYEEDDGKEYDAFISYKSSKEDQDFVLQQLYPKLESEMGFKLCLHFRDFTPGDAIANNIIRAIENSRRTIMILSPNYVDSEWCRMEYQKAQHEMLKLKHKIIPVMFEDISQCSGIDKNLKTILSTVTYLEWPSDGNSKKIERFWKQLELTLPKKRASSSSPVGVVEPSLSTDNLITIIPPSSPISESIPSITSYGSPIATETGVPNHSGINKETGHNDNKSQRIKRLMKDVLKLKINPSTTAFTRLNREASVESGVVTPSSATPSPGLCYIKDQTPLLSRKKASHRRCKSLTWSERTLKHILSSEGKNRSLREKESSRRKIDVIPPSPDGMDIVCVNLPDICRTDGGGYYNIVCEDESQGHEDSSQYVDASHVDCNTCVIGHDSVEDNVQIKNIQSQPQKPCPTCVYNREVDNVNSNHEESTRVDNIQYVTGNGVLPNNIPNTHTDYDNECITCLYPQNSCTSVNVSRVHSVSSRDRCHSCGRPSENSESVRERSQNSTRTIKNPYFENLSNVSESKRKHNNEADSGVCETCIMSRLDPSLDINLNKNSIERRRSTPKSSFRIKPYGQYLNIPPESIENTCESKICNAVESATNPITNNTYEEIVDNNTSYLRMNPLCSNNFAQQNNLTIGESILSLENNISQPESSVVNIYESYSHNSNNVSDEVPRAPKRTKKLSRKVGKES